MNKETLESLLNSNPQDKIKSMLADKCTHFERVVFSFLCARRTAERLENVPSDSEFALSVLTTWLKEQPYTFAEQDHFKRRYVDWPERLRKNHIAALCKQASNTIVKSNEAVWWAFEVAFHGDGGANISKKVSAAAIAACGSEEETKKEEQQQLEDLRIIIADRGVLESE